MLRTCGLLAVCLCTSSSFGYVLSVTNQTNCSIKLLQEQGKLSRIIPMSATKQFEVPVGSRITLEGSALIRGANIQCYNQSAPPKHRAPMTPITPLDPGYRWLSEFRIMPTKPSTFTLSNLASPAHEKLSMLVSITPKNAHSKKSPDFTLKAGESKKLTQVHEAQSVSVVLKSTRSI